MTIPPQFTNELRDRLTLSDIIGRKVKLTRAGREFKGRCPFHHEKTPSFTVNDDKQFYHCFGCGAHGDVVGFVMQSSNLSFIEAVESLAAEAGMQVPKPSPEQAAKAKKEKGLYSLVDEAATFFERQLRDPGNKFAMQYISERCLSDDLLAAFRVGYAPADGQKIRQYLKAQGYTDAQMIDAGITRASNKGGEPYAFFRERVMFPVSDRRGRVVAFGGRALPDHLRPAESSSYRSDFKPPKYINSSDTPLFHKGRMLYGESQARQAAVDEQPVIVVEGYLDVMACFEAGYKGAVAPLGTALTEDQIVSLWKMIPEDRKVPILCFDGDNAGRRAAARAAANLLPLLQPGHSARFAFLPEGQDPDSLIRSQGKSAFKKVLESAIPLVDFIWSWQVQDKKFDTPEDRAGLSKLLEDEASRIADRTVQQYYRQQFRDKLYEAFGRKFYGGKGKGGKNSSFSQAVPVRVRRPVFTDHVLSQQILLAALINHPEIFDSVEEEFGHMHIGQERLDSLRQAILNSLGTDGGLDREALRNHLIRQGFESELEMLLSEAIYTHAGFARPKMETEDALEGWRETSRFMEKKAVWDELRQAGKLLAQDFTEENEQRIIALQDVNKAGNE